MAKDDLRKISDIKGLSVVVSLFECADFPGAFSLVCVVRKRPLGGEIFLLSLVRIMVVVL